MPDLLTHCIAGYAAKRRGRFHPLTYVFILGSVLPDATARTISVLTGETHRWAGPFHTPVGLLVLCWTLAQCFRAEQRRGVLLNLFGGCALHLTLDATQWHLVGGYQLLFPLSWETWELGLWRPETSLTALPYLVLAVALYETCVYFRRRSRIRT